MTVKIVSDSTPGAPTLNGTAGSLINVLDFVLTNVTYGLGWEKAFTATNAASYRALSGNRHYLNVDNLVANNARLRGFETATAAGVAVANGTGPFPTDAQVSGALYYYCSSDTGTARSWIAVGDEKFFYFTSSYNGTNNTAFCFGEFPSFKSTGDTYNTYLSAEVSTNSTSSWNILSATSAGTSGNYAPRAHTQIGGSVQVGKAADGTRSNGMTTMGSSGITYPAPIDGGLLMSRVMIGEGSTTGCRGYIPGLWCPHHNRPLGDTDTFTGTGTLAGRTFLNRHHATTGSFIIETSNTWYS